MLFNRLSGLTRLNPTLKTRPAAFCTTVSRKMCGLWVRHDRENQRFTVAPDSGQEAVLSYRFTGDKQVELMSTFVPESYRGRGLAALLSMAALDFVVEEQLTAQVSCWYIHKYLQENPMKKYTDLIRS
ncbi:protein NATD1-like [Periophthalmus magnuspinnatus]|uniref:protein NATD1-like n=1 Tax=Periophthalmus magnuspinnatus TaxID=409849 RepID=UPI002436CF39|nr:protein NATD1-like [Periophthalmus magnuspinnatus]